jgi:hypothetical protein
MMSAYNSKADTGRCPFYSSKANVTRHWGEHKQPFNNLVKLRPHDGTTFDMNEAQVATISWSAAMVDAIDNRHGGNPHGSTSRA